MPMGVAAAASTIMAVQKTPDSVDSILIVPRIIGVPGRLSPHPQQRLSWAGFLRQCFLHAARSQYPNQ